MNTEPESYIKKLNNILDTLDLQEGDNVKIIYQDDKFNIDGSIIIYEKQIILIIETTKDETIELDLQNEEFKTDIVNIKKNISILEIEKNKKEIEEAGGKCFLVYDNETIQEVVNYVNRNDVRTSVYE